jgi:protocatechuate 3,4-dioxygenase beta subunit
MKRKHFIKTLGMGIIAVPIAAQCGNSEPDPIDANCVSTRSETAGPFPTKDPVSMIFQDITSDRTGLPLDIIITVKDRLTGCTPRESLVVDIWHCDKDGNYSEYGGTGLQSTNYTNVHFLRGRQTTDSEGVVRFHSIFPGWYPGRAPHVHVHIYSGPGRSLLVTQIAFPKTSTDAVYESNSVYAHRGLQDTTNENDNVFRDGFETELGTVTGSGPTSSLVISHTIIVDA